MKFQNQIKHLISFLSVLGLMLLLVFSPCKVRNSIQDVFKIPKTEVSNKSLSTLKTGSCNILTDVETIISKSGYKHQVLQATLATQPLFAKNSIALSDRPITQYRNTRSETPPLVPYYILFKNNKAYL